MDQNHQRPNVVKRSGAVVDFDEARIRNAITRAYLDVEGENTLNSAATQDKIKKLTDLVVGAVTRRETNSMHIEDIQDQVELALMRMEEHAVARSYVIFREKKASERAAKTAASLVAAKPTIHVALPNGDMVPFDRDALLARIKQHCSGANAKAELIVAEAERTLYDGVKIADVNKALIMASCTLIERDPVYEFVTAQILLDQIRMEVGENVHLENGIRAGVEAGIYNPALLSFDLRKLEEAIKWDRDEQFRYLGLKTLYDRYFVHIDDTRIELPQTFFMRVAMGLALNEKDREQRAIEFYDVLSSFDFMASTPTLFNSGTRHSQLSSCYLTSVGDDLVSIYDGLKDNALLSKYAGGLGNDWTNVRALGSHIKGTNGKSQGVIPFLKVVNDTAVAVNQGGKRKGAVCAYLETWHLDIEEFLELRKNTGDDRRRTHDMNTANWIPDLFMQRVMEGGDWTLFSPNDVPDLHDKFGEEFEKAYTAYENKSVLGEIKLYKRIPAIQLWRKMLSMLFETGHPWLTFKDPCNIRSPQQHVGVVHSSNLCTEITLNTSSDEIAVCNLGSVNLAAHIGDNGNGEHIDHAKLRKTVRTAMRMLDNVIDLNYYAVAKAQDANMKHRPVGMGIMGFQDALYMLGMRYGSDMAVEFAGTSMEAVAYYAYAASSDLAAERGVYSTYEGSLWSKGVLPHDTVQMLKEARKGYLKLKTEVVERMDWSTLRAKIKKQGMRNSNCLAIAPTATISNIVGVSQSIEPTYRNLFVKSNLSGEFTVINHCLVDDLKRAGLWDEAMIADLKYFDGSLAEIKRIPDEIRALYSTAFEIDPEWLIEAAAARQVWIDQAQSLNIYMAQTSGPKLDATYKLAWLRGLKTTYYLRSMGATSAEKSTSRAGALNAVQTALHIPEPEVVGRACDITAGPECEACQ